MPLLRKNFLPFWVYCIIFAAGIIGLIWTAVIHRHDTQISWPLAGHLVGPIAAIIIGGMGMEAD